MCFEVLAAGGRLYPCNGSAIQQWRLGPVANGTQQIFRPSAANGGGLPTDHARGSSGASGGGDGGGELSRKMCISRPAATHDQTGAFALEPELGSLETPVPTTLPPPPAPGGGLEFDVTAQLGWKKGAHVRDLWAHTDLGVMQKIAVQLGGDGDAAMYKLTEVQ